MQPAIRIEGISKQYRIGTGQGGAYRTLRESVSDTAAATWQRLTRLAGSKASTSSNGHASNGHALPSSNGSAVLNTENPDKPNTFWALKDVSFDVQPGEVVGIIGRNGAGKSTLLKILSRITEPTKGKITLHGRVASLLEVGTGFHPELTGRENIFLNGAILGMTRREITRKFDEIVDFSGIEKFLDTPVKRYSSGMYVRLAFAVAAHLEPEILIIDEVLAVGDAEFQSRCLGKMQAVAQSGRTVLFVSHNMAAVTSLTKQCLLLNSGRVIEFSSTEAVVAAYHNYSNDLRHSYTANNPSHNPHIKSVTLTTDTKSNVQTSGEPFEVAIDLHHRSPLIGACLSFQIVNQFQTPVLHCWIYDADQRICREFGPTSLICRINSLDLNIGRYTLNVFFSEPPGGAMYDQQVGICPFEVRVAKKQTLFGWRPNACCYLVDFSWEQN